MKRLIISIFLCIVITFSSSFASYTISSVNKQKIDNLAVKIYTIVEKEYNTEAKRDYVYQTIVDTIDGYIVLHKVSEKNKVILLYLKTLLLKHMWYKIWNCVKLDIVK